MKTAQNHYFHTDNTLSLRDEYAALLPVMDDLCARYSALWNHTDPTSDISRINQASGDFVLVDLETVSLIELCEELRRQTDGAFNLLAGAVKQKIQENENVSRQKLSHMAETLLREPIRTGPGVVCCPRGGRIDLGSIAKGFVCDRIAAMLREHGVRDALLDLGGNIYAMGRSEGALPWTIGVRDPRSPSAVPLLALDVTDLSVVTSGMYERPLSFHGGMAHHIIDPRSGLPCDSDLISVTVLHSSSLIADGMTTALTVMGRARALSYARENRLAALLITRDGTVVLSEELERLLS